MPDIDSLLEEVRALRDENARLRGRSAGLAPSPPSISLLPGPERELRFMAAVLDTIGSLVIVLDRDGRVVRFNRACEELTGYAAQEVLGTRFWEFLLAPEEVDAVRAEFDDLRAGRFPSTFENCWVCRDGSRRLLRWRNTALANEDGSVSHVIGTGIDITERRRAEEALSHRLDMEAMLTDIASRFVRLSAADDLDEAIHEILRAIGTFVQVDRAYVFLYSPDGASADNTHEWCAPGIEPQKDRLQGVRAKDFAWWEHRIRGLGLVYIPAVAELPPEAAAERAILEPQGIQSLVVVPLCCSEGILGFLGFDSVRVPQTWAQEDIGLLRTVGDILGAVLERQRAAESVRASEARYRLLVEVSPDAIVLVDPDGRLLDCNDQAARLHGYETAADVVGRSVLDFVAPEERARAVQGMARARETPGMRDLALTLARRDGTRFPAELCSGPIPDAEGRPQAFVLVIRDVTERKSLEEQLLQAQKMESIGRLAGGVAHDFNNLLTVILGYTEIAEASAEAGTDLAECLRNVRKAADRAAALTAQLLAFARKQIIAPRVVDLNATLRETERLLRRLIGEHICLSCVPDCDTATVRADPGQLQQILINLAINARDAMPKGGALTLQTRLVEVCASGERPPSPAPGRYVLLTVADTGAGMPPEVQQRIFEPFYTTKGPGRGTGMGLATVYGIVQQNHGHIAVESAVGRGTVFSVYLPHASGAARRRAPKPGRTATDRGTETVLVAEDEPLVRALAVQGLLRQGYTVLAAGDGEEALAVARSHDGKVDMLVTDVVMPGMGGRELAERLAHERPGLRLLYISGYAEHGALPERVRAGSRALLQKPFTVDALLERVRERLDAPA